MRNLQKGDILIHWGVSKEPDGAQDIEPCRRFRRGRPNAVRFAIGMGLVPWSLSRRARMDVVDEYAMGLAASIPPSEARTLGLIEERVSNRARRDLMRQRRNEPCVWGLVADGQPCKVLSVTE